MKQTITIRAYSMMQCPNCSTYMQTFDDGTCRCNVPQCQNYGKHWEVPSFELKQVESKYEGQFIPSKPRLL